MLKLIVTLIFSSILFLSPTPVNIVYASNIDQNTVSEIMLDYYQDNTNRSLEEWLYSEGDKYFANEKDKEQNIEETLRLIKNRTFEDVERDNINYREEKPYLVANNALGLITGGLIGGVIFDSVINTALLIYRGESDPKTIMIYIMKSEGESLAIVVIGFLIGLITAAVVEIFMLCRLVVFAWKRLFCIKTFKAAIWAMFLWLPLGAIGAILGGYWAYNVIDF